MRRIELDSVTKQFGDVVAVDRVSFAIEPGEQLAILGPSGSGKSTTLRMVAGLDEPTSGDIRFDGSSQVGVAAHERDVALVFQQYALYPHLSVLSNVTLGLRHGRRLGKDEAVRRARDVASRLGIADLLERRPRQLSGGQRQRVALARALARESGIVLLDEPLSGLDAQLRLVLRVEITTQLRRAGATVLHVTHDQSDALTSADRVAVMNHGRIEQLGDPAELYQRPASLFVGRFVGTPPMNVVSLTPADDHRGASPFGTLTVSDPHTTVLGFRPESLVLGDSRAWSAPAIVQAVEHAGPERIVHVELGGRPAALRTHEPPPRIGETVAVSLDPADLHVFAGADGRRVDDRTFERSLVP